MELSAGVCTAALAIRVGKSARRNRPVNPG